MNERRVNDGKFVNQSINQSINQSQLFKVTQITELPQVKATKY